MLPSAFVDSHRLAPPKAENSVILNTIWPASGDATPCRKFAGSFVRYAMASRYH